MMACETPRSGSPERKRTNTGHVLLTMSGTGFNSFVSALILLGVGWNFLYIGGTSLLTSTYTAAEKATAQAINDMTIFAVGLTCSFGAGWLLEVLGWQMLNIALLPWLGLAGLSLMWLGVKRHVTKNVLGKRMARQSMP